ESMPPRAGLRAEEWAGETIQAHEKGGWNYDRGSPRIATSPAFENPARLRPGLVLLTGLLHRDRSADRGRSGGRVRLAVLGQIPRVGACPARHCGGGVVCDEGSPPV